MSGWDRVGSSSSRLGRGNSAMPERTSSSNTVRLGRVQPQAPGYRTIFCNDRDANLLIKFKV